MNNDSVKLYYAHDPMCSWCYGFRPVWQQVKAWCEGQIEVEYLLGGLAPDSDEPMPEGLKADIQSYWKRISQVIPGTEFNYDFWTQNTPKRSTYRSCRAVIAARKQDTSIEKIFIAAIQDAYYLNAKNPSERDTLIDIAKQFSLNINQFEVDLDAEKTQLELIDEMNRGRNLGLQSFPSLLLQVENERHPIMLDYNNADNMIKAIKSFLP